MTSQSRSFSNSATLTPNLCRSVRGSPLSGPIMMQTDSHFFPTSIPAQRSTAAQIMATSFFSRRTVDVYRNMFFQGSTAPFGDTSRQLGQFRLRAQLRTITRISRLLPLRIAYTPYSAAPALIFIGWGARGSRAS